ncbi:hypothetical protein [Salinithrix halophila]|uniref:DUF4244 domain-containing protein n=1 Tax=Salinithrix halophila TaxID=1485204 RepID=A0ABV8J9B7_9BACL
MRDKCIETYVRGSMFMREAVRKVLVERKGATTVEYVAVLAGAAALGAVILSTVEGEKGVGALIKKKITNIIKGIKS